MQVLSSNASAAESRECVRREDRRKTDERCTCGHSQILPGVSENVFCHEVVVVVQDRSKEENVQCITDHPGFEPVCLNKWVLETAWMQFRQQHGGKAFGGREDQRLRHIAYRKFVCWVLGWLRKKIRVTMPSCAVSCIRAYYPPPSEEEEHFTGFKDQ
ncbi:uncharacterized protein LOC106169577 [Lingula anatina]|uniref:Uncharacterized protein LOC106169577 n=1 Tax=Lingula anatina TaxID=7574 RepID=A0A1S3J280_LINAN|nr:uncharacterized protein LOC106169577 [Lingula anatina]|eukprot:XP_013404522.1 uncharacterized protein LOC106169577 [Lingula anatina]